jgi:threonyl-tRNA synthetase
VLPIADRHMEYARGVAAQLKASGIRAQVDERSESVGKKIRDAELHKAPYMLVVGDKEQDAARVAVRRHRKGDIGDMPLAELIDRARREIDARREIG